MELKVGRDVKVSTPPLKVGETLDQYLLLEELGQASRTFIALDTSSFETDVLSVAEGSVRQRRQFLSNLGKFRRIDVPVIPSILAGGVYGEQAFLVSRRVRGFE